MGILCQREKEDDDVHRLEEDGMGWDGPCVYN